MLKSLQNHSIWHPSPILNIMISYVLIGLVMLWGNSANADTKRIVAIDDSLTEIIFALGAGDQLVGRNFCSRYPAEALKLPSIGYMGALSVEGILSLRPNLIIAIKYARSQRVLQHLKEAGMHVEIIYNDLTVEGVKAKIRQVAKILNKTQQGEELVNQLQISVDRAIVKAKLAKQQHGEVRALFVDGMRHNIVVAGRENRANAMLKLSQINNIAAPNFKGYKILTPEAMIQYNPQFIIMMPGAFGEAGGRDAILSSTAISMTEAGKKQQLVLMGTGFTTFGPRLGKTIEDLVNAIYTVKSSDGT